MVRNLECGELLGDRPYGLGINGRHLLEDFVVVQRSKTLHHLEISVTRVLDCLVGPNKILLVEERVTSEMEERRTFDVSEGRDDSQEYVDRDTCGGVWINESPIFMEFQDEEYWMSRDTGDVTLKF